MWKKSHLADGFDEATKDRPGREVVGDCGMMSQRLKERLKNQRGEHVGP